MSAPEVIEDQLPEGWTAARVTELCEIVRGVSYARGEESSSHKPGFIPLIRANNINGKVVRNDLRYVPSHLVNPEQMLQPGDLIVAMSSGSKTVVGKAASIEDQWEATFGAFCAVLRPSDLLERSCFGFFFQTRQYRDLISELSAGVNINNLKRENFTQIEMPLAPVPEQKRIAAHVRELLTKVSDVRTDLLRASAILKRFRQAVLAAACSGRLTEDWRERNLRDDSSSQLTELVSPHAQDLPTLPRSWRWVRIGDIASSEERSIQSGPFGSHLHHSEFQKEGILAIGIDNVLEGTFSLGKEHRISTAKYQQLKKFAARAKDVLITVMATVGRCCAVPEDIETAIITKHVYRITTNWELCEPEFLMYALMGDTQVRSQIESQIRGQTRPGINGQILKSLLVPLPSLTEQKEITKIVQTMFSTADEIVHRVNSGRSVVDRLVQSILAKAFRGELVPTEAELARREGRDYEPASALMGRIKGEREIKATASPKQSRKRQQGQIASAASQS